MEIRHFRLIAALSEVENLSRAAEKLCLSQSALSHQLKELEKQLNLKVYERINKRLVLTPAGHILLKLSLTVLQEIRATKKKLGSQLRGDVGEIRICTQSYTCYHWLPPIIRSFQSKFPNVEINVKAELSGNLIEQIIEGKLDVAVVYDKIRSKSITYLELFTDEIVAIVPRTNVPLYSKVYLRPADFTNQTVVTHHRNFERSRLSSDFLKPAKLQPKKIVHVQLTETIIETVKAGLGISVMTRWLLKPYLVGTTLKIIPLGASGLKYQWYLAVRKNYTESKFLKMFVDNIRARIRP